MYINFKICEINSLFDYINIDIKKQYFKVPDWIGPIKIQPKNDICLNKHRLWWLYENMSAIIRIYDLIFAYRYSVLAKNGISKTLGSVFEMS